MKKVFKRSLALLLCAVIAINYITCEGKNILEAIDAFDVKSYAAVTSNPTTSKDGWIDNTHIRFGSYPQTDFTATMGTTLDSLATEWKSYKYYEETGSYGTMHESDYMMYCDVTIGGNKYRGVKINTYRPYWTEDASTTSCGTYQDDNGYTTGKTYWFRYESLVWRVLGTEDGGTIVMSENIIDSQAFNNYILSANGEYWGDFSKTYFASNYSKSSLRDWLINDFYSTAFNSFQQNKLLTRECNNSCFFSSYPEYNSNPLKTNDKVFLLSYDESVNTTFGFTSSATTDDSAKMANGTDYAKCQGLEVTKNSESIWLLRSPHLSSDFVCAVDFIGSVGGYPVNVTFAGIRPAIKLNLTSEFFQSDEIDFSQTVTGKFENYTTGVIFNNGKSFVSDITISGKTYQTDSNSVISLPEAENLINQNVTAFLKGDKVISVKQTYDKDNSIIPSTNIYDKGIKSADEDYSGFVWSDFVKFESYMKDYYNAFATFFSANTTDIKKYAKKLQSEGNYFNDFSASPIDESADFARYYALAKFLTEIVNSDCISLDISYMSCKATGVSPGKAKVTVKLIDNEGNVVSKDSVTIKIKFNPQINFNPNDNTASKLENLIKHLIEIFTCILKESFPLLYLFER